MTQTIEQLGARVAELEAENARMKVIEESALKVCGQLDGVVIALPYDYLDPQDGGDVSLGEQVTRMYSEVKTLRHAVVIAQAEIKRLRDALRKLIEFELLDSGANSSDELCYEYRQAVLAYNTPSDTSALDAYVDEKVKEAKAEVLDQVRHFKRVREQRDLAVEALEAVKPHVQCDPYAVVIRTLDAIKEGK